METNMPSWSASSAEEPTDERDDCPKRGHPGQEEAESIRWLLTMHGPDGKNYPNESRFIRIEPSRLVEIEHLSGHHFILRIELQAEPAGTRVHWRQTFDTQAHYNRIAGFVTSANEQNLERLALEVANSRHAPEAGLPRDG